MDGQYSPDDEIDIDSLASSEPPEYVPQMFSEGGEVEEKDIEYYSKGGDASLESQTDSMNQFLLADEADTAYAPMYPSEAKESEKDTRTAKMMLKQLSTKGGGKSKRSKEMSMPMGDLSPGIPELGASPTEQDKLVQIASARAQYDALEKAYKLKAQAAQRAGKGLMKPTFNTVMFDQPTLEKSGPLMARTFAKGGPVYRAEGSPASGERLTPQQIERLAADQAALNQYYAAKARPSTGMNRQKGPISQQLDTGEAYINMAKGVTELPYDLAGAPVDIATLLMRPFGYSTEKPVMGSDWIKAQMTKAGVRPEPPADPTAKGFYTAGELLSNLTNPAAVPRKVGPVVEKGVTAVGKEAARQVERGMFNEGPLRNITPQPMYAVRPEGGGTTFTGVREPASSRTTAPISKFDKLIEAGANPRIEGLSNEMGDAIENFWRSKAQNYFTRQYGTPSDPVFKQIISGQLRTPALQRQIPDYALDQLNVGKTRVDPVTGESRFYPKYPQALEDLTRRYDEMTGLEGVAFNVKEPIFDPNYPSTMGNRGTQLEIAAREDVINKLIAGGMNPNLINPKVTLTGPRSDAPDTLLNYVPGEYKELYSMYANPPKDQSMIDRIYKELGLTEDVKPGVPENIKRAIETSEPIYDINFSYRSPLKDILTPENINRYLATKTPAEINKMRFEDVVKNSAKYNLDMFNTQNLVDAIRSGKRVPEKVWTQGISEPLMTLGEGQNKFTWHRIVDNEATAVEGAYLGHSVGGYAKGGSYGPAEYRRFQEGQKQVFTLRDSKGKPFTTVEVEKVQTGPLGKELSPRELARAKAEGTELGPVMTVVRQIKGNGGKTGNTAPKDAEDQVMTFIKDYIRPDKITESDTFLTPKLEELKMDLSGRPRP